MIGVGTRVPASPKSLSQPDLLVKSGPATDRPVTDDALVLVEVLSPSNDKADQNWRRLAYASVPNCEHYVTVSQKSIHVTRYDRAAGWTAAEMTSSTQTLELPALGAAVSIPLTLVYRWTHLAGQ